MTDENRRTDHRSRPVTWVDLTGLAAAIAIPTGIGLEFGIGWGLVAFGALTGGLYALLEVVLNPQIYDLITTALTRTEPTPRRRP